MDAAKILIVEDDYSSATYLRDLLLEIGYNVAGIFLSGEETIQYFSESSADIVLMDIELEGKLDGIETVKELTKISDPFIIYITGLKDKKTFTRAKATFPKHFLSKPFNKYQLLDAIDEIINSSENPLNPDSFRNTYFFIKIKGVYKKILINSISYLKANGSSTDIFFKDNTIPKITISKNLKHALIGLNTNFILRISRSYAININDIESIDSWHIKLNQIKQIFIVQDSYRNSLNSLIKKI